MRDLSTQELIDLQKWWLGELSQITRKLMDQEEMHGLFDEACDWFRSKKKSR